MSKRLKSPEVHAGSMADIAFLLLIFFLVTTTIETDSGLDRMLPKKNPDPPKPFNERNVLRIAINGENQLLLEDNPIGIEDIKSKAIAFLDNGGDARSCNYCKGANDPTSSDNPLEAIISLSNTRETSYGTYITVQNQLVGAYNELRNRESQRLYKVNFTDMHAHYLDANTPTDTKNALREKVKTIQKMYPLNLLEAKIK